MEEILVSAIKKYETSKMQVCKQAITAALAFLPIAGFGDIKKVDPSGPYCTKATGLSQSFVEFVAEKIKVSVNSVRLIRASQDTYGSCAITVDTFKGPQRCVGASIYTDGKDFWIGGSCF